LKETEKHECHSFISASEMDALDDFDPDSWSVLLLLLTRDDLRFLDEDV
jgi:hypothetical protein